MYNFSDILREQNSRTEDLSILNDAYIAASQAVVEEYVKDGETVWIDEAGVQINEEYNDSAEQYYLQKYEEYLDKVLADKKSSYKQNRIIVSNIREAVIELQKQLQDKDWYMQNYRLLDGLGEYLDISKKQCEEYDTEFDEAEQIYNYLAYDLKWEEKEEELFPMEL